MTLHNLRDAFPPLAAALALFFIAHPKWEYPLGHGLMIGVLLTVAVGRFFRLRWTARFGLIGCLSALGIGFVEAAMGNLPWWVAFAWFSAILAIVGRWTRHEMIERQMRPFDDDDEFDLRDDFQEEQYITDRDPHAARKSRVGPSLLLPRSRPAMFFALSSLAAAVCIFEGFRQIGGDILGWIFALPEVVLAIGLWFHQRWVRWFGVLLCLGWLILLILVWVLLDFQHFIILSIFTPLLLGLAWTFWRWSWESMEPVE